MVSLERELINPSRLAYLADTIRYPFTVRSRSKDSTVAMICLASGCRRTSARSVMMLMPSLGSRGAVVLQSQVKGKSQSKVSVAFPYIPDRYILQRKLMAPSLIQIQEVRRAGLELSQGSSYKFRRKSRDKLSMGRELGYYCYSCMNTSQRAR